MPAFVKTPKDEKIWSHAKSIVKENKGIKDESNMSDRHWGLVNYLFHKIKGVKPASEIVKPK